MHFSVWSSGGLHFSPPNTPFSFGPKGGEKERAMGKRDKIMSE